MRRLFSASSGADDSPAPVAARGWDAMPGWTKLAVCGAGVAVFGGAVIFLGDQHKPPSPPKRTTETHTPTALHDYEAPPASSAVEPVSMSSSAAPAGQASREAHHHRYVAHPSEMTLYVAPASALPTGRQQPPADSTAPPSPPSDPNAPGTSPGNPSPLTARVTGATELSTTRATLVRNASFSLRPGDHIACASVEATSSAQPGFVTCRTLEWVRSSDQRRGLLPPGSRIFGQIKSGLAQGEMRLGVLYTQVQTSWFTVAVSAPGGDAMGRAGLDGVVNTFFWDRAGAVALYALMDVGVGAGQNLASSALTRAISGDGGATFNFGAQAQGLASQEMQNRINRPPVLTRDQALPVVITVAQDVDFTDACRQAMQVDPMACPVI